MIDERNFFHWTVENNKRIYENIWETDNGKGDSYTTGSLLDYYNMTTIDLRE